MKKKDTDGILVCDYKVQLNQIAPDSKMRSCIIFDYLQDAAGRHADELNVGMSRLKEYRLAWVLSRIRVRMESYPSYGRTVRIYTYPTGFDRIFAWRQFRICDAENGIQYGMASSAWLTLNPDTGHPVSPQKSLPGTEDWNVTGTVFFPTLGKLHVPAEAVLELPLEHRVSSTEIDYNNHLNNAYYGIFVEDWLGEKMGKLVRVNDIQLNFNYSMRFREKLICTGAILASNGFYVEGFSESNEKNTFQAQGTFEIAEAAQNR